MLTNALTIELELLQSKYVVSLPVLDEDGRGNAAVDVLSLTGCRKYIAS
jgi:hypothetical protein